VSGEPRFPRQEQGHRRAFGRLPDSFQLAEPRKGAILAGLYLEPREQGLDKSETDHRGSPFGSVI
jgi:hypothetical protein